MQPMPICGCSCCCSISRLSSSSSILSPRRRSWATGLDSPCGCTAISSLAHRRAHTLYAAIENTIIIALLAATVSTLMGTVAAIGIHNMRGMARRTVTFLNNVPMINPDIITGISIFLLFVFLGISRGMFTVICAHIAFCTPYVILCVMPRLTTMNPNIYEAALDLGATPWQAFRKVLLPELLPGMVSGFILAVTLSIDDFAVTFFTKGSDGLDTLSTYIYADARKGGLTPELRPLSALIFVTMLLLLVVVNIRASRQKKEQKKKGK